jgi:hypothetical protein
MQVYIDNETASDAENEIVKHLQVCEKCSSLYKEAIEDKSLINKLLNVTGPGNESEIIPEFKHPVIKNKRPVFIRLAVVLTAAVVIGFIFLFRFNRKPVTEKMPEAEILMYEFYDGKDLNKLWHDKSQILIIEDGTGNVVQSIITY